MSSPTADAEATHSRITHGAIVVLAYLHERDAACREVARETILAESTTWQWLTDLEDAGIIDGTATHRDDGRAVVKYHLDDDALGAAAQQIVNRLITTTADPDANPDSDTDGIPDADADSTPEQAPAPMPDADD